MPGNDAPRLIPKEKCKMTDEELKYYITLQPVFKEKMRKLRGNDWIYCSLRKKKLLLMNCKRQLRCWEYVDCKKIGVSHLSCEYRIICPLPIDTENPERGLIGMLKDESFDLSYDDDFDETYRWRMAGTFIYGIIRTGSPTLALLKALASQEGITV